MEKVLLEQQESLSCSEVRVLYDAILDLFQTLKMLSCTYFDKDYSKSIITLNVAISYFSNRQNNHFALGICHNNLANVLLQSQRYQEALEHYSASLI